MRGRAKEKKRERKDTMKCRGQKIKAWKGMEMKEEQETKRNAGN